ncbi:MAG: hypothetical protein LUD02_06915 [Tannerellaceae bacterium]|nr:hypothetical protein [Tannerellaceae bacterium]MCD8263912.1 hypothetical protein [Tannerellaceae bacterium]
MKRFSLILLILFFVSCTKVQEQRFVLQTIYLIIDLTARDKELVGTYNFKEITAPRIASEVMSKPYIGVLVISGLNSISGEEAYYAFDLRCPYEANNNTKIQADPEKNGYASCPTCGSKYDLRTGIGFPTGDEGPSTYHLISYPVNRKSTNEWVVSNY